MTSKALRPQSFRSLVNRWRAFESLENRLLLAGDFMPGDANFDYHVDEADLVQAMKFGKFGTGETATWEEGDWDEDSEFTSFDLAVVFRSQLFGAGAYDEEAGPAVNHLTAISTNGVADVTLFYFPLSGDVTAISSSGMTALHLVSRSGSFLNRGRLMTDYAKADSRFLTKPEGYTWIEFRDLMPIGWTEQEVVDDLLVDGAIRGGGGLGNVRFGALADYPAERDEDSVVTNGNEIYFFVDLEDANGLLTYDPQTGDILIEGIDVEMQLVELTSPGGLFTGTIGAADRYIIYSGDATPHRFIAVAYENIGPFEVIRRPPFSTLYLPGIARTGLSHEEFFADVSPTGISEPHGRLRLALKVGQLFEECRGNVADGTLVGDANLDGQFDTQDLVSIFQAGEYEDEFAGNSTWNEGDWTCDGDFDTSDLVAAFQSGSYELPKAAIARAIVEDRRLVTASGKKDDAARMTESFPLRSERKHHELVWASSWTRTFDPTVFRELATDEIMLNVEIL